MRISDWSSDVCSSDLQKKTDVIGAVTTVNPSELKVPASNLTTALAGRIAGMIAYQRSGEPGRDNADFFIRGVTTFAESRPDPLILIRSEERRGGKECVSPCRSRWWPFN